MAEAEGMEPQDTDPQGTAPDGAPPAVPAADEFQADPVPPASNPPAEDGTLVLEIDGYEGPLDILLVPVGGGGLISGCALAAAAMSPGCAVVGVEPAAGNDVQQSLAKGEIVTIPTPRTIADGAQTPAPGRITFALMRQLAGVP